MRNRAITHCTVSQSAIPLHESHGEARVDSRIIAAHLGVQHHTTFELIKDYADDFKKFGVCLFKVDIPHKR